MKNIIHLLSIVAVMLTVSCGTNDITNPPTQNPVDVYVAGTKDNHACYWKNNQEVVLNNDAMSFSNATKIIVSNNDVYVLGNYTGANNITKYVFWKNGVMINLSQTLSTSSQYVNSITDFDVSGNDVYLVGVTGGIGTVLSFDYAFWKNGVKTVFSPNNNSITSTFIKFHNNTIYLIGGKNISGTTKKGYFVNNDFTEVSTTLNGFTVKGNDVYVYGGNFSPQDIYYKNITTGQEVSFLTSQQIKKMVFDGSDRYTNSGSNVRKNDVSIYETQNPNFNFITDFEVKNTNTYILTQEGDLLPRGHLYLNNVDVFSIPSGYVLFNDLAIVQK